MGNTTSTSSQQLSHSQRQPATSEAQLRANTTRHTAQQEAGDSNNWFDPTIRNGRAANYTAADIPYDAFATFSDTSEEDTTHAHSPPPPPPALPGQSESEANMPPITRRRPHPRDNNSVVDLTSASSPPQRPAAPRSLKRSAQESAASASQPTTKRPKPTPTNLPEELDLAEENPSAEDELVAAQQAQTIAAQQAEEEDTGPLKIGKRQCIICMEPYTNATVTHCGHIYCHECLTQALIAGEKNSDRGVGNCPVCRKSVQRKRATQVIPLAFMKKSAFKGKGRKGVGLLG